MDTLLFVAAMSLTTLLTESTLVPSSKGASPCPRLVGACFFETEQVRSLMCIYMCIYIYIVIVKSFVLGHFLRFVRVLGSL